MQNDEVLTPEVEVIPPGVEVEDYKVPGPNAKFPLEISGAKLSEALNGKEFDNAVKGLGDSDPSKFAEALTQVAASLGIITGSLISLKIGGKILKPAVLTEVTGETIQYRYLLLSDKAEKKIETTPLKLVENIEVLHSGQSIAKQEIDAQRDNVGAVKGVSAEQIDANIKELVNGKEVLVTCIDENGQEKIAKIKFSRNDSASNEIANAYANVLTKQEHLSLDDIPKYGIFLNEAMRKELLATSEVKENYYTYYQTPNNKIVNAVWKLYVDKDLNKLRFRSAVPTQNERIALEKNVIIDLVKELKVNGFEKAWAVVDTKEEIKNNGIQLYYKASEGKASILFSKGAKPKAHLYINWLGNQADLQTRHLFVEKFKPAVALVESILNGEKISQKENQGEKTKASTAEAKKAQAKKNPKQKIS